MLIFNNKGDVQSFSNYRRINEPYYEDGKELLRQG